MSKFGPRYYKPAGIDFRNHMNAGGEWFMAGSKGKTYTIEMTPKGFKCDCPGFKFRGKCKHTVAIAEAIDEIVA